MYKYDTYLCVYIIIYTCVFPSFQAKYMINVLSKTCLVLRTQHTQLNCTATTSMACLRLPTSMASHKASQTSWWRVESQTSQMESKGEFLRAGPWVLNGGSKLSSPKQRGNKSHVFCLKAIGFMRGMFAYIRLILCLNMGKSTIHGSYILTDHFVWDDITNSLFLWLI